MIPKPKLLTVFASLTLATMSAVAQTPIITSLAQNGVLICSNLSPGSLATVQWASSLSGPWYTNWAGLFAVSVSPNGVFQAGVPMFYRVIALPPPGMALIPAGSFTMGDNLDNEGDAMPTVTVNVSGFYADTNLVSYGLWQTVYNWATNAGYTFDNTGSGKASNHPVQTVNWFDAIKWCNARSQQAGLTPVYYTDSTLTTAYKNGDAATLYANWQASGFRLPSEAEWEKAARGGLTGARFPQYDVIMEGWANYYSETASYNYDEGPDGYSIYYGNSGFPYTSPVGAFQPNGYGLFDMYGNVEEWCWDWYATPYVGGSDPHGPVSGGTRLARGGAWVLTAYGARCANRDPQSPTIANYYIGFRCVRSL